MGSYFSAHHGQVTVQFAATLLLQSNVALPEGQQPGWLEKIWKVKLVIYIKHINI